MSTILIETERPSRSARGSPPTLAARNNSAERHDEKGLRLAWALQEFACGVDLIERGQIPPEPLQIEIHPYHCSQLSPCNNRCIWCTRLEDKTTLRARRVPGIEPARLLAFIASLNGSGVRRIVISGNSTEPLLYPRIEEVIRAIHAAGLNWVLYTNFYLGQKIVDVALTCTRPGDVLRVSLDAGKEESYLKTHRPQNNPGAFRIVTANLTELLRQRAQRQSPLTVGIAYLMTGDNSSESELREAIEMADTNGADFIRFSVPLKPTHQNPEFALTETEADRIKRRVSRLALEYELRRQWATGHTKIYIRQDEVIQGAKSFNMCHHCKLIPVIGVRGKVYPCTSTSTADFDYLGIGDINQSDFTTGFWDIWNDPTKWRHDVQDCPDCTRFEYDLNVELDRRVALTRGQGSSLRNRMESWSGTKSEKHRERMSEAVV